MKTTKEYKASGWVLGNCWGGGKVWYQSNKYQSKTLKGIEKEIQKGIENGSIDSGMGFESILGAIIDITEIEKIDTGDGEPFKRENSMYNTFGEIEDKAQEYFFDEVLPHL